LQNREKLLLVLLCPSTRNSSASTGWIFTKFYIWRFFENLSRKLMSLNSDKNRGILHDNHYTFLIIYCSVLHKMRNVTDKSCRENQNTHFMINFFFDKCAVYEIMWKNTEQPDRPQIILWCKQIARWIPQATSTQSECVIIMAFQLQQ